MDKMLKGKGFVLRKISMTDKYSVAKYANNKEIYRNTLKIPYPYGLKDAEEYITKTLANYRKKIVTDFVFCIDINGECVGTLGIHNIEQNHKAEIGYWLGEPFWGKGIMTKAVKLATTYFFKEFKLKRIVGCVFTHNEASARVLQKNKYKYEGILRKNAVKKGRYLDEAFYARTN